LTTEAEAREARYAFLAEVKASVSTGVVLTGHTADDQAETVLFRAVRGSGPDGLVGIRPAREDGVERPLLRVWRTDIETYAMRVGLPFREDPSNRDTSWTRNRIRNVILPALEEAVPGAKSSLARLAVLSEMQREALEGLSSLALGQCAVRGSAVEGSFVLDLAVLSAWPDAVIAQVLREAGRRLGLALGSGAVERTLRLIRQGRDGASVDLAGRHAATRSSGALRLGPTPLPAATEGPGAGPRVVIPAAGETGQAQWSAGAGLRRVRWGPCRRASPEGPIVWSEGQGEEARLTPGPPPGEPALKDADAAAVLSAAGLTFPLELRTRKPGDRMEWTGHDRRLKKIMTETGVPSFDRDTTPVLADALGSVLWIPGLTASGHGAETVGPGRGPSSQPAPDWFCVTLSRLEGEAEP
ncbi:MAG: tRNA lysidine(34) synthetase TilS, partial [Gemmatimonadetes bacterium]|nr:tRNA lysidine(34) synthetase TilS [Gemmatimonadota bacterium]